MNNSTILHRFDNAKLGKFHLRVMLIIGSCWVWAAYGVTIVGFMLPSLQEEWQVSSSALGFLASIGMVGMLAGSVVVGSLSDRFGRRKMLMLTMFYLGIMFFFNAITNTYQQLLALRFFTGIGLGAIIPIAGTFVAEFCPTRHRGTLLVLLNGFWGLGGTLAALVGYSLILHYGWRPSMFFGMLTIISGILVRWQLPESLRYLIGKGEIDQAQKEADRVRLVEGDHAPVQAEVIPYPQPSKDTSSNGIWSKRFAKTTFSIWVLWFSLNFLYQGIFIWLPTLLAGDTSAISRSFLLTLFISLGQIPGTLLVAYVADKFSRKKLIIFSLGLLGVAAIIFSLSTQTAWVLIFGFMLMIFNGMAWGLAHPFSAELYPTSIRGSATGWGTGVGRLGGVLAPMVVAWIIQFNGSLTVIFTVLAAAPALTMVILAGLKQETTGRTLEDINN